MDKDTIELLATVFSIAVMLLTIVGFLGKPIITLNKTLTKLNVTFEAMDKRVCKDEVDNEAAHKELRVKDGELEHVVNGHTKDIAVIKQVLKDDLAE